jgi:hypothetical protein
VLSRKIIERKEACLILPQACAGSVVLYLIQGKKMTVSLHCLIFRRGQVHVMDVILGTALDALWHLVQNVCSLMNSAALLFGLGKLLGKSRPESQASVTGSQLRNSFRPRCFRSLSISLALTFITKHSDYRRWLYRLPYFFNF